MTDLLIKSDKEIEIMRKAGKLLSSFLSEIKIAIKPGIDIWDLEEMFIKLCEDNNAYPACKGFTSGGYLPPFPTGLCISINNESVHCFPRKGVILKDGDIVSVDTVISLHGYHADAAFCMCVGNCSDKAKLLVKTTEKAFNESLSKVKSGVRIGEISNKLQKTVEKEGFNVLRDYAGHGIGSEMHESPEIPCFGSRHDGMKLKENMTICIESLVCSGNSKVTNVSEWETKMADGGLFSTFEHTILVTKNGYEILTK